MAGDDLKVLHVHDNDQSSDQHLPVFYGDTDWRDFRRALEEIGFDGVFSLEFEGAEENLPALRLGYAYMRKLADMPVEKAL